MKFIFLFFLLFPIVAFAQKQPTGVIHEIKIVSVSDGDTVIIEAPYLPAPLKPQLAVRIFGVDTPEKGKKAQCTREAQLGEKATEFTKRMIAQGKKFHVVLYGWDKFGGRVLGDLLINGNSLRQELISKGFAREYYGDTKKSWC